MYTHKYNNIFLTICDEKKLFTHNSLPASVMVRSKGHKHSSHLSLAFHIHDLMHLVCDKWCESLKAVLWHVDLIDQSSGVHATGHVHSVPPDVIQHFVTADNPRGNGAIIDSDSHAKYESVTVDLFEYVDQVLSKVDELREVMNGTGLIRR